MGTVAEFYQLTIIPDTLFSIPLFNMNIDTYLLCVIT